MHQYDSDTEAECICGSVLQYKTHKQSYWSGQLKASSSDA